MTEQGPRRSPEVAARYHETTKHSPDSVRGGHLVSTPSGFSPMDWSNQPNPFKTYEGAERIPLPRGRIGKLLEVGAGVKKVGRLRNRFRNYASAGGLYPIELYLVTSENDDLDAGVYHFSPSDGALTTLRRGDHRGVVVRATANEPSVESTEAIVILTGIPWRTTWKYTQRGYRHLYWDAGMVLANFLALLSSDGTPARVVVGFVDEEVEKLVGVDGRSEFPLCLLTFGKSDVTAINQDETMEGLRLANPPLSRNEFRFPEIEEVNDAGRLGEPGAVARWRDHSSQESGRTEGGPQGSPRDAIERAIGRRGSARYFGDDPMPRSVLEDVLSRGHQPISTDYAPEGSNLIRSFLVVNNVEGVERGAYLWRDGSLEQLSSGDFRREAGYLCLEQPLGSTSSATIFLMADLGAVIRALGARGYRSAQLEGGAVGGAMYLAAYDHRFGATGLTFYDDEVTRFFSPAAEGLSCMLVVALGDSPRLHRD